jgi:hypothetical protein
LNRLRVPLVLSQALLKREGIEVEVKGNPSEAKWTLRGYLSEQPLSRATHDVTLAMSSPERVADCSRKHRRKKISLRLHRGGGFKIIFGQKLVGGITHTSLILQVFRLLNRNTDAERGCYLRKSGRRV